MTTNINEVDSWLSPIENSTPDFLTPHFLYTNYIESHDNDLKVKKENYMKQENTYPSFPKELVKSELHLNRYIKFIDSRSTRLKKTKDLYLENHHKVPKALGGSDDKENMILLTGREHFIAHMILWKAFSGSMWFAFNMMRLSPMGGQRHFKLSSKQYQSLKDSHPGHTEKTKKLISRKNKGKQKSQRMKVILSIRMRGNTYGRGYKRTKKSIQQQVIRQTGTKRSEETKSLMSRAQIGHITTEQTKLKIGLGNLGKNRTEEFKENRSKTTHLNKKWKLVSPKGVVYSVTGLLQFCKVYSLSYDLFMKNKGRLINMKVRSELGVNTLGWTAYLLKEQS